MTEVCIIAARRTPFGRFLGGLSRQGPVELALHAGRSVLDGIQREAVDQVIVGNILGAGHGMNVARQIAVGLDLPLSVPAFTVNMMCASGLQAVALGAQAIRAGDARVVLCGGTESMSQAPHLLPRSRTGLKLGDGTLVDSLLRDGLEDAFDQQHMGLSAEALAGRFAISREEQDAFALASQQRQAAACEAGLFRDELTPVGALLADEHPRADTTLEGLAQLRPAFDPAGTVTAGNASGINDGAGLLLLASRSVAEAQGWPVLAVLEGVATVGCDPREMGLGPVHAIRRLCSDLGASLESFDAIEINEAFAAQVLACLRELELDVDRVNAKGGAIAIGHPIGASGARLLIDLAWRIHRGRSRRGLAALCVGGGMGVAAALRSPAGGNHE